MDKSMAELRQLARENDVGPLGGKGITKKILYQKLVEAGVLIGKRKTSPRKDTMKTVYIVYDPLTRTVKEYRAVVFKSFKGALVYGAKEYVDPDENIDYNDITSADATRLQKEWKKVTKRMFDYSEPSYGLGAYFEIKEINVLP